MFNNKCKKLNKNCDLAVVNTYTFDMNLKKQCYEND